MNSGVYIISVYKEHRIFYTYFGLQVFLVLYAIVESCAPLNTSPHVQEFVVYSFQAFSIYENISVLIYKYIHICILTQNFTIPLYKSNVYLVSYCIYVFIHTHTHFYFIVLLNIPLSLYSVVYLTDPLLMIICFHFYISKDNCNN